MLLEFISVVRLPPLFLILLSHVLPYSHSHQAGGPYSAFYSSFSPHHWIVPLSLVWSSSFSHSSHPLSREGEAKAPYEIIKSITIKPERPIPTTTFFLLYKKLIFHLRSFNMVYSNIGIILMDLITQQQSPNTNNDIKTYHVMKRRIYTVFCVCILYIACIHLIYPFRCVFCLQFSYWKLHLHSCE